MIAYDKKLLENTFLIEEAVDLKKSGFIKNEDLNTIKLRLQGLRTNRNIFVRAAFLLLGAFLYISLIGVIFLVVIDGSSNSYGIGFTVAVIGLGILELLCNQNFFRHGLDDAFLVGAQLALYTTIVSESDSAIALSIAMMIAGLLFAVRYVNTLSFLVFVSGIVLFIGSVVIDYTTISAILPFVLLLVAIVFYLVYQKLKDHPKLHFYENTLQWFFIYSLVLGYASVNYFMVRTLSEELLAADYSHSEVPFGWFFYVLMFAIPLVYIFYGVKTKNRIMLYIGGLTFAVSIATFRYYHSVLPAEWALLLSGSLLFAFVYFVIQKLKNNATGVTFQHDYTNNTTILNNIEALIVNSQDMKHAEAGQQSKMPFGGGDFSGGGSGGSF